jgi:hypothetical protein|tara:strand:+ start:228 stop:641 length:414 start_codon:yes stop_codon:yes gene_type:complete
MKITRQELRKIISQELTLNEAPVFPLPDDPADAKLKKEASVTARANLKSTAEKLKQIADSASKNLRNVISKSTTVQMIDLLNLVELATQDLNALSTAGSDITALIGKVTNVENPEESPGSSVPWDELYGIEPRSLDL